MQMALKTRPLDDTKPARALEAEPNAPQLRAELSRMGLRWISNLSWNDGAQKMFDDAITRGEGVATATGGFSATTGQHTGRSAKDKYIVRDAKTETRIWWDNTASLTPEQFNTLKQDFFAHARLKSLYVQDLKAGADPRHELNVRIVAEQAWHALFMHHMLIVPQDRSGFVPGLTIVNLPSFKADPARHGTRSETIVALDLSNGLVLIGGTEYAGEMKKAVFSVLNDRLPDSGILPMHCSANVADNGDTAIFFGLSGTGKTTLSADPERRLIGDDEHGWSADGIFNFEGGCYAKAINLTAEAEQQIHAAALAQLSVLENVVLDHNGMPDFTDISLTENTRAAYPLDRIANADVSGQAGIPKTVIMLTADAFGVLPPIAKLTPQQAMYYFLSGYTAKLAGTERGVTEPTATFSACFGAPFLPRHPAVYGDLLRALIARHKVQCYLINTGWTGGAYGTGHRIPLKTTRTLLHEALSGVLAQTETRIDPLFGFDVPRAVQGVPARLLNPRKNWADAKAYDLQAAKLVELFQTNFRRFADHVPADVAIAGPMKLTPE
jgi:phosphoenolpyruvate carboxykinase (ATP)